MVKGTSQNAVHTAGIASDKATHPSEDPQKGVSSRGGTVKHVLPGGNK